MPDSTNNEEQKNTSEQGQSNNASYSGGGKKICFGADQGCQQEDCTKIQKGLEDCGNTVHFTCIDPNQESHMKGSGADFNVFFCNGVAPATMWSFREAIKAGSLPFTIFAFITGPPYHNPNEPEGELASMENIRKVPFEPEHDANFMGEGSTATMETEKSGEGNTGEWLDKNSQYVSVCSGNTAEELAQNICSGTCGGGSGSSGKNVNSGGGAQIKDKTFEKCIRRICAATDSVFLVENNAAVLFPYTDWMAFTLRQKINTIKTNEIDPNIFSIEYGNEGFYNKVTIAWGGATLPERFPSQNDSKQQTIEDRIKPNYTVEDILKNMSLTNFNYNQKAITQSTIINQKKKTTQIISTDDTGATTLSEQYDSLVKKYGEMEKRVESMAPDLETAQYIVNALLIQYVRDFNNSCKCRALNTRKYVGGTFYAVENPSDKTSELYFLQGYTIRTQKNAPLYHDLEFKYGPEGAEEILDYQTLSGGAASGDTNSNIGGGSANEEQVWTTAAKISYAHANSTQDPEEAWKMFGGKEESSSTDCYGMSAYLYYCFNNQANIPCQVVGDSGHHVVMIDRGQGMVETRDEYRKYNFDYLFKWRNDQNTSVLLPAPGTSGSTSGGNTNKNNTNSGNRGGFNV